jgi:hypothetical protein
MRVLYEKRYICSPQIVYHLPFSWLRPKSRLSLMESKIEQALRSGLTGVEPQVVVPDFDPGTSASTARIPACNSA